MLTHQQAMQATFLVLDDGVVIDFDESAGLYQRRVVMTKASVGRQYFNLLRASGVMYQTIHKQSEALDVLITTFEAAGADQVVSALLELQSALHLTKRLAIEGFESVADCLPKKV